MAETLKNKTFIHYGSSSFDKERFLSPMQRTIKGEKVCVKKPSSGGLWASPIDTKYGWKESMEHKIKKKKENNEVILKVLPSECFSFQLKHNAKVLVIDNFENTGSLKLMRNHVVYGFDFEDAATNYDAIFLSEEGLKSQGGLGFSDDNNQWDDYMKQKNFFTWDCVTLLVLNPDSILINTD